MLSTYASVPSTPSAGPETGLILAFSFKKKDPADLLLVADHRGRITSMTAALGAFLGHDAAALVSTNTFVSTLLPQPWAQLTFPQWLRDANQQGAGRLKTDAVDSSRAALASAGQVVQLLTGSQKQVLARLRITTLQDDEQPFLVVAVHKTTVEAAHDLRRLRLQVGLGT